MKSLLTIVFLSTASVCAAQAPAQVGYSQLPLADDKVTFTAVVPVGGATKDELFNRAQEWAARTFANSRATERVNDKEAGLLVTRGAWGTAASRYNFTVAVTVKEGRYKYQFDQVSWTYATEAGAYSVPPRTMAIEEWRTMRQGKNIARLTTELNTRMAALAKSLDEAMQGKAAGTAATDW